MQTTDGRDGGYSPRNLAGTGQSGRNDTGRSRKHRPHGRPRFLEILHPKGGPAQEHDFNPKESIDFNGNTGPFIQYTYARIRSVLRKAAEQGIVLPEQLPTTTTISEKEENLIQMIADYASVVREAGKEYSPALIANYTYDLVKEYNQFYHDFSILREENEEVKEFRLVLSANVAKIVKSAMSLLGIEVPERM
mgnify:CR=1 FL=1